MDKLILSIFTGKEEYKGNDKTMVKRIITTEEYFYIICNILTEKGLMPDVVKCSFAAGNPIPMTTFNFRIANDLYYDGGIYLRLWHKCVADDGTEKLTDFGTFCSLRQDREAMQIMGKLLADVLVENKRYVNDHLDGFTWEGTDVCAVDQDGNKLCQYHMISSKEEALQIKDKLLNECSIVIMRDNITRKETIYKKRGDDVIIVD